MLPVISEMSRSIPHFLLFISKGAVVFISIMCMKTETFHVSDVALIVTKVVLGILFGYMHP